MAVVLVVQVVSNLNNNSIQSYRCILVALDAIVVTGSSEHEWGFIITDL